MADRLYCFMIYIEAAQMQDLGSRNRNGHIPEDLLPASLILISLYNPFFLLLILFTKNTKINAR
jgi:hypothetical protein